MEKRPAPKFTPRAIELFKQILAEEFWSEKYQQLDHELWRELKLKLWQGGPVIVTPDMQPSHPEETPGGRRWQREEGPALYRDLCAAAGIDP